MHVEAHIMAWSLLAHSQGGRGAAHLQETYGLQRCGEKFGRMTWRMPRAKQLCGRQGQSKTILMAWFIPIGFSLKSQRLFWCL